MAAWPIRLNSNNPDKFRRSHTPPHALIRKYSYADRGASPYDQYRNGKTVWLTRNIGKVSYYTLPKEGKTILKRKTKSAGLSKDMAHNDDSEHFTRQAMDKYKNQEGQKLYTVHCECLLLQHVSTKDKLSPQVDTQWGTLVYRSCIAHRAPQSSMRGIRYPAISTQTQLPWNSWLGKWSSSWAVLRAWQDKPFLSQVAHLLVSTLARRNLISRRLSDSLAVSSDSVSEVYLHRNYQESRVRRVEVHKPVHNKSWNGWNGARLLQERK